MTRLYFSDPYKSRTCDKCDNYAPMSVSYECRVSTFGGVPVDEYLELTCIGCGYVQEMDVNK